MVYWFFGFSFFGFLELLFIGFFGTLFFWSFGLLELRFFGSPYSRMTLLQATLCIPNRRASLLGAPGVFPKARENTGWHGPSGHAIQYSRSHRIPIVA